MEARFRIRTYPTADRYLRRSRLRIPLSETTPDNPMRFYDKDVVAARPNVAFMPFGAEPHRCFGAAMGYLRAQFLFAQIHQRFRIQTRPGRGPATFRPPLLIQVPTARWCSLAALTSTENFIVLEGPVSAR